MYAVLCCAIDDALDMLEKVPDAQNTAELLQTALLKAEKYVCRKQQLAVKLRGRRLPAASGVLFQISAFVHERRERDNGGCFASEYARAHRAYVKPYLARHIGLIRLKAALGACYHRSRAELLGP